MAIVVAGGGIKEAKNKREHALSSLEPRMCLFKVVIYTSIIYTLYGISASILKNKQKKNATISSFLLY